MSLDLGDLSDLATAIGLVDGDGNPVGSWFAEPGRHLSEVLSNGVQRRALVSFVDGLLGGEDAATDAAGRSWLPVVEAGGGAFRLFATVQEADGAAIPVGAGVRLRVASGGVECAVDAHVPLFRAAGTQPVANPLLLGQAGAPIEVALRLRFPPDTAPGRVALAGVELAASVPTSGGGEPPALRLVLRGLRMPGAAAPRDLVVAADSADRLDDVLLELVLGLVQAQVASLPPASPLRGLASMLGLADDAVPDLPVADLIARGPAALAEWFAAALSGPARQDWLAGLAALLGGNVVAPGTAGAAVEVAVNGATLRLELRVQPGASGRPAVTAAASAGIDGGPGGRLAFSADLVTLDLGSGTALALPRLALTGRLDPPGAAKLLPTVAGPGGLQLAAGALEIGFALDADRRPVLVIKGEDVDVGATHYDVLDLSTPEALAAVAGQAVADAASAVLDNLGAASAAVRILLGLADPPGAPGLPRVAPGELLRDPVGALRGHWRDLVTAHAADVPAVLEALKEAVADARVRAVAVAGTGTEADPWRVPLVPGVALTLVAAGERIVAGFEADLASDLGASGVRAALALRAGVARLDLAAGTAAFLTEVRARLSLGSTDGQPLRLASGDVLASVASLGADIVWRPDTGLRVAPVLDDAHLHLPTGDLAIPPFTLDGAGRLSLDDAGWRAMEGLVGALASATARRADLPWLASAVDLLGWSPALSPPGQGSRASGAAPVSLAALVADPAAALAGFARALLLDDDAVRALLQALADLLARGALEGAGAVLRPWVVALVSARGALAGRTAATLPAVAVTLGADGPPAPVTTVPRALRSWMPGEDGFEPDALVAAMAGEGALDEVIADLLAGRGDVGQGLSDLMDRWAGTDGLVTLPDEALPDRVTGHRPAELAHGEPLAGPFVTEVLAEIWAGHFGGAAPQTLVFVAVDGDDRHGAPEVLPTAAEGFPAGNLIDLSAPGLPPEAFTPAAAGGAATWAVRLGSRAASRLPAGHPAGADPDGVAGQAARLRRFLDLVAGAGRDVAVVAHGGAGHAALRAVEGLAGIRTVVTLGTPWTPLSVDTLDAVPAGEALRLLAALIRMADAAAADPADPAADPDDPDLASARRAVAALLGLDPFADPLADLRPPGGLVAPAGIPVHAVVGSLSPQALRRAFTAAAAAALAARARLRAAAGSANAAAAPLRAGLRLPLLAGGSPGGLAATLLIEVDLASLERDAALAAEGPGVRVSLDIGATTGWLVGGPDPGRASGGARVVACRRLSASVALPIRSWGSPLPAPPARARLVLHEASAFGTLRDRWTVEAGPGAGAGATPLLPEVRAILAEVAARLSAAAAVDSSIAALRDGLAALGLLGPDGGVDPVTLERLLLDPGATALAARLDGTRRQRLAAALRVLGGDARDAAVAPDTADLRYGAEGEVVAHIDLRAPSLELAASSGTGGAVPWEAGVSAAPAGIGAELRIGPDTAAGAGPLDIALVVSASASAGLTAMVRQGGAGGPREVPLWPAPVADLLLDGLTSAVPPLALQALANGLRPALRTVSAAAADALDALFDAVGLRPAAVDATGDRPMAALRALMADPAAWVRGLPAGLAGSLPALVTALRGLLGAAAGPAGTLALADGVAVRTATQGARLLLSVEVDAAAFTPPAGGLGLTLAGGLGVSAATATADASLPDLRVSLGLPGTGSLRLRVGPDAGGAGDAVGVTLSLAPVGRPEIVLLPAGPGLAGLANAAAAGAVAALPALLDALAAQDPAGAPATAGEIAGRLVVRVGDVLGLRTGAPARFDAAALAAFGSDPAGALASRAATLSAAGLAQLAQALQPLLGNLPSRQASVAEGALAVRVGPATVRWRPGASVVEAAVALDGLPGIESLAAEVAAGPTGLVRADLTLGPAALDAGVLTLSPFARLAIGSAQAGGSSVDVGLGIGADRRLAFRWDLDDGSAGLVAVRVGATPAETTESRDPGAVAAAVVGAVLDLAGGVVLALPALQATLGRPVLGATVGGLLDGVLLAPGQTDRLDPTIAGELADPALLLRRLGRLAANLASAPGAGVPIGGVLTVRMAKRDEGATPVFGLNVAVNGAWELNPGSDVLVSLEEDASWIAPPGGAVPPGLTVELIDLPAAGPPRARPGLVVGGLGVRVSRASGPLLNAGVSVGSVAAHLFGAISSSGSAVSVAGGVRLELAALAVALAGARGGDNAVAQGVMGQAGSGEDAPAPRFSPALALQKHAGQPLRVSLTAGPGSGPWWLTIQREFGPVYLEQVGLAVVNPPSGIESVGVLIDGRVSLMGLSAAVDDLSLTYVVATGGSALDPNRWRVDLAGFAVAADVAGVTLAGGLRRFTPPQGGVEYLGMLTARLAVYGLSVYGGYGIVGPENDRFTSLFLFGAVNGPIGGPPAFFVTGIGGGFGINRRLVLPADLSRFGDFPLIKALDPAARAGDPFRELEQARVFFPPERGAFWFAAGLSFNSFALVDGIAVVAVQIGGGFEFNLLGLARVALPRPEAALVSIELALVARFSTREGVILVQGQLTDNSWLLAPAVRLTGGFAFASWFSGPNRGQFVVSIGGYHPDFHRDGYPVVPRLGFVLKIGDNISITGESYFALTSEAVMAGARMEISAQLGPAWAHLVFGGDAIVFFDPFRFKAAVYASIDAGVTIDLWLGEISISVHLSARIEVTAPPLHAVAHFEVGPVGVTFEIGSPPPEPRYIAWDAFVRKYLEEAAPGRARVLAAATGAGTVPPSGSAATGGAASPDGTPDRPFRVLPEFEATITSTAPLRGLLAGGPRRDLSASATVWVAPMGPGGSANDNLLTLAMVGPAAAPSDRIARLEAVPQRLGAFPIGVWGTPPDQANPVVPSGDVIDATDRVLLRAVAEIPGTRPGEQPPPAIPYRQVETGKRRILPFVVEDDARRAAVRAAVTGLSAFVPAAADASARIAAAATLLAERGGRSAADVAAWGADRSAPPQLGFLGEGLGRAPRPVAVAATAPPPAAPPAPPRPPRLQALLTAPEADEPMVARLDGRAEQVAAHTTVDERVRREIPHLVAPPPSLADIDAGLAAAVPARLLRVRPPAAAGRATVLASVAPPLTRTVLPGVAIAAGRAAEASASARLADFARALARRGAKEAARVAAGEIAVLDLPDADRDGDPARRPSLVVENGRARIVAIGPAGRVAVDRIVAPPPAGAGDGGSVPVPPATRSLVAIGLAADPSGESGVAGWVADVPLPSASDGVLIAAGCVLDAVGRVPVRGVAALRSGWVAPDELVRGESAVTTTFAAPVAAVAVALEGGTGPDLVLGVEGASRPVGADGAPEGPVLVADGSRAVLVFRLVESRPGTALTVTTGAARRLAGVAAMPEDATPGADPAAALAAAIGRNGLAAFVPPVAAPGVGGAGLRWKEG